MSSAKRDGRLSAKRTSDQSNREISSTGADRARRYRMRRRHGVTKVSFDVELGFKAACFQIRADEMPVAFGINSASVDRLIETGWLNAAERENQIAVTKGFMAAGLSAMWPEGLPRR